MDSELEVRLLDVDKEAFIAKLESVGAEYVNTYAQIRYVYDFKPKIENKWIRLRTDGHKTTLTIKEAKGSNIGDIKELEIEVSDMQKTDLILEQLGYQKRSVQENKRIRYMLNGVEIDIDTWPHLNTFVEFEGKTIEELYAVLELLNISKEETTTMDPQDIYLANGFTLEDMNWLKF